MWVWLLSLSVLLFPLVLGMSLDVMDKAKARSTARMKFIQESTNKAIAALEARNVYYCPVVETRWLEQKMVDGGVIEYHEMTRCENRKCDECWTGSKQAETCIHCKGYKSSPTPMCDDCNYAKYTQQLPIKVKPRPGSITAKVITPDSGPEVADFIYDSAGRIVGKGCYVCGVIATQVIGGHDTCKPCGFVIAQRSAGEWSEARVQDYYRRAQNEKTTKRVNTGYM